MSISTQITRLQNAKTNIKTAIENKGVSVSDSTKLDGYAELINNIEDGASVEPLSVTANGTYTAPEGTAYSPVSVNVPSGGGSSSTGVNDVIFRDYDGSIVTSYTATEFAELTAMPENPNHKGLVAQGWNWSLANAQAYVAKYGRLEIGQMYITESGDTEIDVFFAENVNLSPIMTIAVNGTVTIDWGDGTEVDTMIGTSITARSAVNHKYLTKGKYTIKIHVISGEFTFYGNTSNSANYSLLRKNTNGNANYVYANTIQAIRLGIGIRIIKTRGFGYCYSLTYITIPNSVNTIESYAFGQCNSLVSIVIPINLRIISNYMFNACYSLSSITFSENIVTISDSAFYGCYSLFSLTIPEGVTSIGNSAFNGCTSLSSLTIPDGVTSMGSSVFHNCYSLSSLTIPDGVTSIGNSTFSGCGSLSSLTIPDGVTSIGSSAFGTCYSLASLTIPDGVTSIGSSAFNGCTSLSSLTIPDGVTSIEGYVFSGCHSLSSLTIPDNVTSIGSYSFQNCYGISEYHLKPTTPPTLSNVNAFSGILSNCIIYVPQGCLEAYQTATNWVTYANKMQEEP